MKAIWNNQTIAESNDTIVVEGNHYFPADSVDATYLQQSTHTSFCGWKGTASYYDLVVDGQTNPNAVWYYPEPFEAAAEITGRLAFWKDVKVVG